MLQQRPSVVIERVGGRLAPCTVRRGAWAADTEQPLQPADTQNRIKAGKTAAGSAADRAPTRDCCGVGGSSAAGVWLKSLFPSDNEKL